MLLHKNSVVILIFFSLTEDKTHKNYYWTGNPIKKSIIGKKSNILYLILVKPGNIKNKDCNHQI